MEGRFALEELCKQHLGLIDITGTLPTTFKTLRFIVAALDADCHVSLSSCRSMPPAGIFYGRVTDGGDRRAALYR